MFLFKSCKIVAVMVLIRGGPIPQYSCPECQCRNFRLHILIPINSYVFLAVIVYIYIHKRSGNSNRGPPKGNNKPCPNQRIF